ncbi:hypothetical protein GGH92_009620, partial [Coemansia sp. RSA 2673]
MADTNDIQTFIKPYLVPEGSEELNRNLQAMAASFAVTDDKISDIIKGLHKSMKTG